MLMLGCCWVGVSERGAFGFSNEKSLIYWAKTLSCGGFSGAGPPFVELAIPDPPAAGCSTLKSGLANTAARMRQAAPLLAVHGPATAAQKGCNDVGVIGQDRLS